MGGDQLFKAAGGDPELLAQGLVPGGNRSRQMVTWMRTPQQLQAWVVHSQAAEMWHQPPLP
jgi:hypothetical protein